MKHYMGIVLGVLALFSTLGLLALTPVSATSTPRKGADKKSCIYNGTSYSHGAVVCQSGLKYECNDGYWDALNQPCSREGQQCR